MPLIKGLDKGRSLIEQVSLQAIMHVQGEGAGLKDAEHHKGVYDKVLTSRDFSDVRFYVICLDKTPEIMCSAGKLVTHDFEGNVVQDLGQLDALMDLIAFSLIATDEGGAAVFQWVGNSEPCEKLIRSLDSLTDEEIPHALVRFIFEFFENKYFRQSWWNSLNEATKKSLQMRSSLAADSTVLRRDDCLIDDGIRIVTWSGISRHTNMN